MVELTKLCKLEKTKKHIHYTELYFRIDINSLCQSTLSLVSSQTPKLCKLGWVWNPRQPIMLSTHQQQSEPRKLPPLLSTFYGTVVFQINCSFQFSLTFIGMLLAYKDSTDMYCTNCIYILGPDYFYLYLPIKGRTIFFFFSKMICKHYNKSNAVSLRNLFKGCWISKNIFNLAEILQFFSLKLQYCKKPTKFKENLSQI